MRSDTRTLWRSRGGLDAAAGLDLGMSVMRSAQEGTAPGQVRPAASRIQPIVCSADVMAATGCSKSTASSYRTGRRTPHPMYWNALQGTVAGMANTMPMKQPLTAVRIG